MRILFVENHVVFARTVVEEFLARFKVNSAPSLTEARQHLAAGSFEALLVDFDLDDGNARLIAAGADAICPKARLREIRRVLEEPGTSA